MKFLKPLLFFSVINFGTLGLGSWLMNDGPQSYWYKSLNQAPWTPEGWVFGIAWTSIMVCFAVYMTFLYLQRPTQKVKLLYALQILLNVSWNYIFFNQHLVNLGLATIVLLTIVITAFMITYFKDLKVKSILILPYLIWLCIATSLNLYISLYN